MTQKTQEKESKAPQQSTFIHGVLCEYTGNALLWNSCERLTKRKRWWVYFSNCCVYALHPEEQQPAVLPLRHISHLGLQMPWFLPFPEPPKHPTSFSSSCSFPLQGVAQTLGNSRALLWLPLIFVFSLMMDVSRLSVLSVSPLLLSAINDFLPIYLQK